MFFWRRRRSGIQSDFGRVSGKVVNVSSGQVLEDKSAGIGFEIVTLACPTTGMRTQCVQFQDEKGYVPLQPGQHVSITTRDLGHDEFGPRIRAVSIALVPA